jgi:hypothetical protein
MSDDRLSWAVAGWRRMEKGENSVSESVVSSPAAESTAKSPSQPVAASTTTTDQPDCTIDVNDYRIEVQLIPDQHLLRAGADITFIPLQSTRSVVFELNGALHVESVERKGKPLEVSHMTRLAGRLLARAYVLTWAKWSPQGSP